MKKIISSFRTFFYFLSEILEFTFSLISSLFPSSADPDLPKGDIYIVNGYLSGTLFYSKLCKVLESKGYRPKILKVPSFLFSTKKAVEILAKQMDQIPSKSVLLAHNTGGLLALLLPDRSRQKIRGLVTLGTPFRGSYLFSLFPLSGLYYGSEYLKEFFKTFLFMDRFHPLSPLKEFIFLPASSSVYGEGRDLWFDIPGNYNQVRKTENIRTILEFLSFHYPSEAARESEKQTTPITKARLQIFESEILKGNLSVKKKSKEERASKSKPPVKKSVVVKNQKTNPIPKGKTKSVVNPQIVGSKTKNVSKKKSASASGKNKSTTKKKKR
ncbi:esterase/lipase family protein [Leptospira santarosai]|uniref:esterase/lipase family protein n=1 Tax=Leptospira santarosai TaxID=28183 RepID=UPI0026E3FB79|nr:alpha/beta hydrolase [Leptospira santarosai]MDO6381764.1 alpha/beta hydrolase [Leptospira santarosai]